MSYGYTTPKTEEERRIVHKALTGEETPPPRGTRRAKLAVEDSTLFWFLLLAHGALIVGEIYIAWKQGWIK